ncbi:MAG: T9SS type A sorting domain-containing protein [Bacteroidota bacterium]
MKVSFILILFAFPFLLNAQGWEKNYGGIYDEQIFSADQTPDGGILMAGLRTIDNIRYPILYKTDEFGQLQWEYTDVDFADFDLSFGDCFTGADGRHLLVTNDIGLTVVYEDPVLRKIDPTGQPIWVQNEALNNFTHAKQIAVAANGDYLMIGDNRHHLLDAHLGMLNRVTAEGEKLWFKIFTEGPHATLLEGLTEASNGDIMIIGIWRNFVTSTHQKSVIKRLNFAGEIIWEKLIETGVYTDDIIEVENGNFIVAGTRYVSTDPPHISVYKMDGNGNEIWHRKIASLVDPKFVGIHQAEDGGFFIAGYTQTFTPGINDFFLMKLNALGEVQWVKHYGRGKNAVLGDFVKAEDGGFFLAGHSQNIDDTYDAYLVKVDSDGNSLTNRFTGRLYWDENANCVQDNEENVLAGWVVEAAKDNEQYYDFTDKSGQYALALDTGAYQITFYPLDEYWDFCEPTQQISFSETNQIIHFDNVAQAAINCPSLEVSITTPLLRRCFENTYIVNYRNNGTTLATDAYVQIVLDPYMTLIESSLNHSFEQFGDSIRIELGDLEVWTGGSFTFQVALGDASNCDSIPFGISHCVEARIFPDSICWIPSDWSGASVQLDGSCQGDSLHFSISNVGIAPMQTSLDYLLIENDESFMEGTFQLNPEESLDLWIAANGSSFRLEADQEAHHPGRSRPSIDLEACGSFDPSTGFVQIFAQDDGDAFIDIDCQTNIGAFDPNDKAGFPLGRGTDHYIDQNQAIDYFIRFQNTGTDTAFNVVISDKISELLDLSSIRLLASSHPYEYDLNEEGVLVFTFKDIMLPDSNVNQVASNGFIKFQIDQKVDLPLGSQIFNQAAIFFDYNAPVITNTTVHTVGDLLIPVSIHHPIEPEVQVEVYPNPFEQSTTFEIRGAVIEEGVFSLYNMMGQKVRSFSFSGPSFRLWRAQLKGGMYFFSISDQHQLLASGKLMVR